jgi:multidrug resistance efflux pump
MSVINIQPEAEPNMPSSDAGRKSKVSSDWKHPKMRWRRIVNCWPFLVWLAAIAICALIYSRGSQFGGISGIVDTLSEPVAPLVTARLTDVYVSLGQRVKAGDKLAQLDTSLVDAAIARAEAEMFEQASSIGNFERSALTIYKTFENAINDADSAIEDLKRRSARDTAQLNELHIEQKRIDGLLAKHLIGARDAYTLRAQIVALEHEVDAYPSLITIEKRRLVDSKKGKEDLEKSLRLSEGEDIKDAIARRAEAQRKIFESSRMATDIERDNYTLRASRDGVVSRIFHQPGNVINEGEAILRIVDDHPQRIIGFLPEVHLARVKEGDTVAIWAKTRRLGTLTGIVESIAPELDALPGKITPISGQQLRGRRIIVKIEGEHELLPGETVQLTRRTLW